MSITETIAALSTPPGEGGIGIIRISGDQALAVGEGGYYWTQFQGNYLFHSVPFDKDKKIEAAEAAKLGTPASHGCVRLSIDDAKWIYDHIPRGTEVTIR